MITQKSELQQYLDDPAVMAVSVLRERISRLPREDQDDLWELFPAMVSGSTEEQESACRAMLEILEQSTSQIRRMPLPDEPESGLESWISFVSKRLRDARKAAAMTQEDLATRSGIPQSHISRLENGTHSPTSRTLEKLASALGVPVTQFDPSV